MIPLHGRDWDWVDPSVPASLRALYQRGYQIVVFSNQLTLTQGSNRAHLEQKLGLMADAARRFFRTELF